MALEIYFKDDIERVIAGLAAMAVQTCVQDGIHETDYISGVLTMTRSIAVSFGCDWPAIVSVIRSEGYGWVLDQADVKLLDNKISP